MKIRFIISGQDKWMHWCQPNWSIPCLNMFCLDSVKTVARKLKASFILWSAVGRAECVSVQKRLQNVSIIGRACWGLYWLDCKLHLHVRFILMAWISIFRTHYLSNRYDKLELSKASCPYTGFYIYFCKPIVFCLENSNSHYLRDTRVSLTRQSSLQRTSFPWAKSLLYLSLKNLH